MKDVDNQLPTLEKNLNYWLRGDSESIIFCLNMFKTIHLWDDLIDKDNDVRDDEINNAFTFLMVDMPLNVFYIRNYRDIAPMMNNIINKWHTANVFEKEKKEGDIEKAYMLRAELYQLFVLCATLVGGRDWGRIVSVSIWRSYIENLNDFTKEVENA
jgi:hypothetical protein